VVNYLDCRPLYYRISVPRSLVSTTTNTAQPFALYRDRSLRDRPRFLPRAVAHTPNIPFRFRSISPLTKRRDARRFGVDLSLTLGRLIYQSSIYQRRVEAEDLRGAFPPYMVSVFWWGSYLCSFPNWRDPSCLKLDRAAMHMRVADNHCSLPTGPARRLSASLERCAHFLASDSTRRPCRTSLPPPRSSIPSRHACAGPAPARACWLRCFICLSVCVSRFTFTFCWLRYSFINRSGLT
jgi:hypothetical protein